MNAQLSAVVLGVVEGLTEFLPVSSTGHLIVAEQLIGYKDAGETFTVVIQLGAILAVVFFYWRLLLSRLAELFTGKPLARRFWGRIVVACLPSAVLGLVFERTVKAHLFTPTVVAVSLIVGGVLVLYVMDSPPSMQPLVVSKVNTAAQIVLAALALAVPGFAIRADPVLDFAVVVVAATTLISGAAYVRRWALEPGGT